MNALQGIIFGKQGTQCERKPGQSAPRVNCKRQSIKANLQLIGSRYASRPLLHTEIKENDLQ